MSREVREERSVLFTPSPFGQGDPRPVTMSLSAARILSSGAARNLGKSLGLRLLSTSPVVRGDLVSLRRDESSGITTVSLSHPPVNSFTLEFSLQLATAVREAEKDEGKSRAILLTTALPNVFSAGLDLTSVLQMEGEEEAEEFWTAFQDVWYALISCRLPTASCITGHAIAGGAMFSTITDYKVEQKSNTRILTSCYTLALFLDHGGQPQAQHRPERGQSWGCHPPLVPGLLQILRGSQDCG